MATSRIYYQNFCDHAHFGGFNVAGGAVAMWPSGWTPPYQYRVGTAIFNGIGTFTGVFEVDYVVQVQSSTDGTFAGTRIRWSDTDGATWNVENITPVSGVAIPLNNGLSVMFQNSGITPQFVANDTWRARAIRPYGIAKVLDGSRNTEYRSGALPSSSTLRIGWDLGVARQPSFLAVDDHNIPNNATTTLLAHPSTLFTETGGFSQPVTYRANRLVELIVSSAFRFWWLRIVLGTVSPSPMPYIRISEFFLGLGATFLKAPDVGMSVSREFLGSVDVANIATRGSQPQLYLADMPQRTWSLVKRDATEDGGKLDAALTYATTHPSGLMTPFYFIPLDDTLAEVEYNAWVGSGLQRQHRFLDRYDYTVNWAQVIRTAAS